MRRNVAALAAILLCCLTEAAVGQADGVCETFATDSAGCVAPCTGKPQIDNMVYNDNGPGYYHIINVTFTCSASGTNSCSQTSQVPTAEVNPSCPQTGGAEAEAAVTVAKMAGVEVRYVLAGYEAMTRTATRATPTTVRRSSWTPTDTAST
jgi:hypothetical protein